MINTTTLILTVIAWVMIFFFSGIEVAFMNANKLSIELKKKQGLSSGILLSHLLEHPARFIGTTLIGYNLFLVTFGLLVGETFLPLWNWLIVKIHIPSSYVNVMRLSLETLLSAILSCSLVNFFPNHCSVQKATNCSFSFPALLISFTVCSNLFFTFLPLLLPGY